MANSKIIIVEGPQGAGKTTITDYIRHAVKHTNLYRLSGTSDASISGKIKAKEMYDGLLDYIKTLENKNINLLFDRTFFTEENYCRLGKKDYSFTDVYELLLTRLASFDFEILYINLYLKDELEFEKRLVREGKAVPEYAKFTIENSILQQRVYLEMLSELENNFSSIRTLNVDNSRELDVVQKQIIDFINGDLIKEKQKINEK